MPHVDRIHDVGAGIIHIQVIPTAKAKPATTKGAEAVRGASETMFELIQTFSNQMIKDKWPKKWISYNEINVCSKSESESVLGMKIPLMINLF